MCREARLDPPAPAVAEPAARQEEDERDQQQQPEQRAHTDPAGDGEDYQDDQNQLYEAHRTLLVLSGSSAIAFQ
jgi:hypothetical protein